MIGWNSRGTPDDLAASIKPKLLVLTSTFPRWPGDSDPPFVYELSRRLTKHFEVTVHAPHYPGARTRETMDGIRIHRFRYFFEPFEKLAGSTGIVPTLRRNRWFVFLVPFFLCSQFCSLLLLIRKQRPELLHSHWLIPQGFFAGIVGRITGIPVVVTAHGTDIFAFQGKIGTWGKRLALRHSSVITVVSSTLARTVSQLVDCSKRLHIVPMGVDGGCFHPVKKEGKQAGTGIRQLLFVGRLIEIKGIRYLLEAMPMVLQRFPAVRLQIIGSGELEQELKALALSLGLQETVCFSGSLANDELPAIYRDAEIFIGPSIVASGGDTEGFGLTFVEAAMSGCLVIGTDTGGIGDIIEDGVTGFLVPQKDEAALAERIIHALEHKATMDEICVRARERAVERFDWAYIAGCYNALFQEILKHRRVRRSSI